MAIRYFKIMFILLVLAASMACCPIAVEGAKGEPGTPAPPVAIITAPATLDECPTGGSIITIGTSTVTVCNGAVGAPGPQGDAGAIGPRGDPGGIGDQGPQGPRGDAGSPGIDATPITIVQFCHGNTNYPNTFAEIGFCINNNIYAVYSEHDGFLTYVPPGNYYSNAHNSACAFTVGLNCSISYQ